MTIQELKNKVIKDGIKSVKEHEKAEKKQGGIIGFKLCEFLNTPQECEEVLRERKKREVSDEKLRNDVKEYWKYRYATIQIELWYEILKVAFNYPVLSSRAVIRYSKIVGVKEL